MEILTKVFRVNALSWWLLYLVESTSRQLWVDDLQQKKGREEEEEGTKRGKCHRIPELFQYTIKTQQAEILNVAASG